LLSAQKNSGNTINSNNAANEGFKGLLLQPWFKIERVHDETWTQSFYPNPNPNL
jgi:hypothetical protein